MIPNLDQSRVVRAVEVIGQRHGQHLPGHLILRTLEVETRLHPARTFDDELRLRQMAASAFVATIGGVGATVLSHPGKQRSSLIANGATAELQEWRPTAARPPGRQRTSRHTSNPAVGALLAGEDRINSRLHVVVDPACAGAFEERECSVMRIEHHLLAFARIGTNKKHAAMAKPDMGSLHLHRHAIDHHDLVAPVELVGLARFEDQGHKRR